MNEIIEKLIDYFELDVENINRMTESNSSQVYHLVLRNKNQCILKLPFNKTKYEREIEALRLLDGKVNVPIILGLNNKVPAILMSYIDGVPLEGPITNEMAFEMGRELAKIHSIPVDLDKESYINHLSFLFNKSLQYSKQVLTEKQIEKSKRIFNTNIKSINIKNLGLTHNDYRMGNVLVKNDKIVGIIDFEVANAGLPVKDLSIVKREIWDQYEGTKEAFITGYETIKELNINLISFFEFLDVFTKIGWFVKRMKINNPLYSKYKHELDAYL